MPSNSPPLRTSFNDMLTASGLRKLADKMRRSAMVGRMRSLVDDLRSDARTTTAQRLSSVGAMAERVVRRILTPPQAALRPAVNATGVILPRAAEPPLADSAVEAMLSVARDYRTITDAFDSDPGAPPATFDRGGQVEQLMSELTGAEAAIVFNHPAGAVLAVLSALAAGREIVVARGHLSRIRGHGTLADLAVQCGAQTREIGAVNCASSEDYQRAIGPPSALLCRCHSGEFTLRGICKQVSLEKLAQIGQQRRVPVLEVIEVGSLIDLTPLGCRDIPVIGQSIVSGADLVIFGGDMAIGGPSCGILVGRAELIERVASHPMAAALGAGSLTLAALGATLEMYREVATATCGIPLLQLLAGSDENLRNRAERLAAQIRSCSQITAVEVKASSAYLSDSRLDSQKLSSWSVAVHAAPGAGERLHDALHRAVPPVWCTAGAGYLEINLRSVLPRQDEHVVAAFVSLGQAATLPESPSTAIPTESAGI